MKNILLFTALISIIGLSSCEIQNPKQMEKVEKKKAVVYQVFTRLFGNQNSTNKVWGTIEENGVGKFNHFTDKALEGIKELGVTHVWYTGVPHHDVIRDYTQYGISNDDPDVVKGRAGSPYAVKDYYNVNPDLAVDPANRLEEFKALIDRTHKHGMKVIIDIVPNHVARNYHSISAPEGVRDFGADDNTDVEYEIDNNFYYVVGEEFKVPEFLNGYKPLGGEEHPLSDGKFDENPAKWTGNGARDAQPNFYDWYETVKINYGVRPDGSKEFTELPSEYASKDYKAHLEFWSDKKIPSSWIKFRDIALFWTKLGVDGFRYDMAEMVPVEFWSFMNSSIKEVNPDAFLLAEIYNPKEYRNYIHLGKMDYLYDKVELYDTLKNIIQGKGSTNNITQIQKGLADIDGSMLHFLENHDEQRIASPEFAGNPQKAKPAMVVSALIGTSPTMIYFGQEVGEDGSEDAGFGTHSRTSIFDYIGVPAHQRWMNNGEFDGGKLSKEEKELREFYKKLLNISVKEDAFIGSFVSLQEFNQSTNGYNEKVYSFLRENNGEAIVVCSNFDAENSQKFSLKLDIETLEKLGFKEGNYKIHELLSDRNCQLVYEDDVALINVSLKPLESIVVKL